MNFLKDVKRAGAKAAAAQKETSNTTQKPFNLEYYKDKDNQNVLKAISYSSPSSSSSKKDSESNSQQGPATTPTATESIAIARDALKRQEEAINAQRHISEESLTFKRSQLHAEQVQLDIQRKKVDLLRHELEFTYSSDSDASNGSNNNREKRQKAKRALEKEVEKLKRMSEELRVNQRRVRDEERQMNQEIKINQKKLKQEAGKLRILEKQNKSIGGGEDRWKESRRIRREKGGPFVESDGMTKTSATDAEATATPNGFFENIWSSIFNKKSKATNGSDDYDEPLKAANIEEIIDHVGEQLELAGEQLGLAGEQLGRVEFDSAFTSNKPRRGSPSKATTAAATELAKPTPAFASAEPKSVNARPVTAMPSGTTSHAQGFHHRHPQSMHYPSSLPTPSPSMPLPSQSIPSILSSPQSPPPPPPPFIGHGPFAAPMAPKAPMAPMAPMPPMPPMPPILSPYQYTNYNISSVTGEFGSTPPSYENELPPVPAQAELPVAAVPVGATAGKGNAVKKEFKIR
ncbi:hypothetical protein HK100_009778, partial [Physocladia obscura]